MADYKSREFDAGSDAAPANGNAGRVDAPNGNGAGFGNGNGASAGMNGAGLGGAHLGGAHSGGPQGHSGSHPGLDSGIDNFVQVLSRQWHVMLLTVIAAVMLSVLYVMVAKQVYTAKAVLTVSPVDAGSISSGNSNVTDDTDFLDTQCVVIKSNAVLALAMDKIRDTRTLHGIPRPMDYVKAHLVAEPAKTGKAIEVSFDSTSLDDASLITDSVVQAYKEYESNAWKSHAEKILEVLKIGTSEQKTQRDAIQRQIDELIKTNGSVPDVDPDRSAQHLEVTSLLDEKRKDEVEHLKAKSAYDQASRAIIGNAQLIKKVEDAEATGMYSTNPQDQLTNYQKELALQQARLVDDSRQFGANHPVIVADQARVDAMIVATVVASHEWVEMTQTQMDSVDSALKEAEKKESDLRANQEKYRELQEDAERLRKNSEQTDDRAGQLNITKSAGALNIDVLNSAEQFGNPKPEAKKTTLIGLVLGVMGGLALACVRDWTEDRIRTPAAMRSAVGAQVLGGIPSITTAYTASDRGQIVHHDPFGDAAESFRTLRTALQFSLPAGSKTILVTSPVSGDGKSTFVSNLGIVLAQASMKVLIVDADLRAPMQHRLFGLKDRMGLSTVLSGADTLEQAVQQTGIDRLDVLPCGPSPLTPSEMLNSPAFTEMLEELAGKYDIVLLDSPPVTAVADARILAACADVSMLVIRLETSTRKQAEAARDGLRSVGARLIGVAVNGVARNSGFGGATGYYPHVDAATPSFSRNVSRPARNEGKSSSDSNV
jgi:succinoglycan biosynthesis transport protein ExoP